MRHIWVTLLLIISLGCSNTNRFELKSYEINKFFSKKEISELNRMVAFVDSIVLSNTGYEDVNKSYWYYLDSLVEVSFSFGRWHISEIEPEAKYDFLNDINPVLFSKIWFQYLDSPYSFRVQGKTFSGIKPVEIDLNPIGVYAEYIRELGETNKFYKDFYEACFDAGGLSPNANANFFVNNNEFDFNDSNNRLFVAILLLSQDGAIDRYID